MKIKLIGTGAIYTRYNSACTLINDDLIIDVPNGTLKQMLKMGLDPAKIKTIIITHMHGDHTADIPFLLKYIFNYIKSKNEIKLIGPKGIRNKIVELSNAYNFENKEEIDELFNVSYFEVEEDNEVLNINGYSIKPVKVSHGLELAYGYVINNILGLTGDSGMCDSLKYIFENSKYIVTDASLIEGDNCHLGINDIITLRHNSKIICTHVRDMTREKLKELKLENVIIEEDGFEIEI